MTAPTDSPQHLDDEAPDTTPALAATLGLSVEEFVELFGGAWQESPSAPGHDFDADPSGGWAGEVTPWHLAGDPWQLMIRVFHHGVFLAMPQVRWWGGVTDVQPEEQQYVGRDELDTRGVDVVKALLARRRRSFRYCRYCYTAVPPEWRFSADACSGCATRYFGVVY